MKRLLASGLFAVLLTTSTQAAGPVQPHFPPFGCGGFCMNFLGRIHQHGPLFNYGPYAGYYPFEPYGPWTSDLRYNPPSFASCKGGHCGGGCGDRGCSSRVLGGYVRATLSNLFNRLHPMSYKCGKPCGWGVGLCSPNAGCETATPCLTPAPATAPDAGCAPVAAAPAVAAPVQAAPAVNLPAQMPATMPVPMPAPNAAPVEVAPAKIVPAIPQTTKSLPPIPLPGVPTKTMTGILTGHSK
jgi:hypothetical protein